MKPDLNNSGRQSGSDIQQFLPFLHHSPKMKTSPYNSRRQSGSGSQPSRSHQDKRTLITTRSEAQIYYLPHSRPPFFLITHYLKLPFRALYNKDCEIFLVLPIITTVKHNLYKILNTITERQVQREV